MGSVMSETLRIREFSRLDYKCPRDWLQNLREIEELVIRSTLPHKVRALRTHRLRYWNETRQAALFAYGMSKRMPDFQFDFACAEGADYDAVIRSRREDEQFFTPIQLKEYVPEELNANATLEALLNGLSRYSSSSDLVVVVYLNRRFRLRMWPIYCPPLNVGGLYLVGATSPNKRKWLLVGNLLEQYAGISVFDYPNGAGGMDY
jgi:hypothetical protein